MVSLGKNKALEYVAAALNVAAEIMIMVVSTKKRSKNRNLKAETIPTVRKGKLVEQITAAFHESQFVSVRRNAWLPVVGTGKGRREIDVLVTGDVAGYSVRLAFECKNERSPIGVKRVDEFIGRLKDVGIPPQHGVLVSASGYTKDAIGRGERESIRLLTLAGLTKEGLSSILYEVFQAVVFLMVDIAQLAIGYKEETGASEHPYMFFNDSGEFCGYLHHFVWDAWRKGLLPFSIGEHALDLGVPPNLYHVINKELRQIESISIKLKITGFVISFPGKAEHLLLLDAKDKSSQARETKRDF